MTTPHLMRLAAELAHAGTPFVFAHVVRRDPPSSARVGDVALVTADGGFHGWLGGSCTQETVVREARRAIRDGQPLLLTLAPDPSVETRPGVSVHPMTCHSGGSVEIYIEPVLPAPRLLVFGASPVAVALARVGKAAGYAVDVIADDADAASFPDADRVLPYPAPGAGPPVYAVVATFGVSDEAALEAALSLRPRYLGVIASRKRFAHMRTLLEQRGADPADVDRIRAPAGLDLGAETPEEIALSVLAELVQVAKRPRPLTESGRAEPAPAQTATDPVCGMTVSVPGAVHVARFNGDAFYFCCPGCRERFLAAPHQYVSGRAGGGRG